MSMSKLFGGRNWIKKVVTIEKGNEQDFSIAVFFQ